MARSRNIKPGFFTNDLLGDLPALTRLLFAGIWTLCDREGRLEDRPKKIRAEVLPYDQCDADEMLSSLDKAGFIKRYQVDGKSVIQVLAWSLHQNPHIKEAPSTLPAFVENCESTMQAPDLVQPLPERAGLIPSLLIPDSLNLVVINKESARAVAAPDGVSPSLWTDFKKLRVAKKAAITDTAMQGIYRESEKAGVSMSDALTMCCERGWATFKADWYANAMTAKPAAMTARNNTHKYAGAAAAIWGNNTDEGVINV